MKRCQLFPLIALCLITKSFALQTITKVHADPFSGAEIQTVSLAGDDIDLNKQARDSLFQRYGREDYDALKADIFRMLPDMQYPGSIVAAAGIFSAAKDISAFQHLLDELDPQKIPDDQSWQRICELILRRNDRLLETFLQKCPNSNACRIAPYFSDNYLRLLKERQEKASRHRFENMKGMAESTVAEVVADTDNRSKAAIMPSASAIDAWGIRVPLPQDEETALSRQIAAVKKQMECNPDCIVEYARLLPDAPRQFATRMNARLEQEKNVPERKRIVKQTERFFLNLGARLPSNQLKDYEKEMRQFADLLDKENTVEFLAYIHLCMMNKWFKEIVPYLEKWQNQEVAEEEMKEMAHFSNPFVGEEIKKAVVLKYRHNTLIAALMQCGRADEAQKMAEKYYGNNVDAHSISIPDYRFLGAVQAASGADFFKRKLEKAVPPPEGSLHHYEERLNYLEGKLLHYTKGIDSRFVPMGQEMPENMRKEREELIEKRREIATSILKLSEEAIQAGRGNDHALFLWGMSLKANNLMAWQRPFDYKTVLACAREAWEYAVKHIPLDIAEKDDILFNSRGGAAIQYVKIMDAEVRDSHVKFFRQVLINGRYQVPPNATEKYDQFLTQAEAERDRVLRRDLKDGFYSIGLHLFNENRFLSLPFKTVFNSDDEIFQNILDPSFMMKHAPHFESREIKLHQIRLMAVPLKPATGEGFEACLKQAIDYFNTADALMRKRGYSCGQELSDWLRRIHFKDCIDAEAKNAIINKYIYNHYPDRRYMIFNGFVATLPACSYEEGKQLLETSWRKNELRPEERQQSLKYLMEHAPTDTEREWCKAELKKFGKDVE